MIQKKLIALDVEKNNKVEIIREIAEKMEMEGNVLDVETYVKAVLDREKTFPTCFDFGVAIPHGKTDAVKEACFAFYRLKNPLKWCDEKEDEVRLVFQIAVPETDTTNIHLKILAQLSRHLMHEDFREKLLTYEKKEDVEKLLKSIL